MSPKEESKPASRSLPKPTAEQLVAFRASLVRMLVDDVVRTVKAPQADAKK